MMLCDQTAQKAGEDSRQIGVTRSSSSFPDLSLHKNRRGYSKKIPTDPWNISQISQKSKNE